MNITTHGCFRVTTLLGCLFFVDIVLPPPDPDPSFDDEEEVPHGEGQSVKHEQIGFDFLASKPSYGGVL